MQNMEAQHPYPTLHSETDESKHFPAFMIGISLIQVIVSIKIIEKIFYLL